MEERDDGTPVLREHVDERRGCDEARRSAGARSTRRVSGCRPTEDLAAADEPGLALVEDERAVGEIVESRIVQASRSIRREPLLVQLRVDVVGPRRASMVRGPDLAEA